MLLQRFVTFHHKSDHAEGVLHHPEHFTPRLACGFSDDELAAAVIESLE